MTPTPRQQQALDVIRASVTEKGYPPSVRELADALGLASPSSAAHLIRALAEHGHIEVVPGLSRAIRLTDKETTDGE